MKFVVEAKPNAHKNTVEMLAPGRYRICVTIPPDDNKANLAIIKLLAKFLDLAPSKLKIIRGQTSRKKIIEIVG